jgi:F-type H+-transporting ATPase subunit alpha
MDIPVGRAMLGRVVNPLGQPIDGLGHIEATGHRPIEFKAPGIMERQPVNEPVQTGLMAIDAMVPIGRGQRELIIGDRKTGKTAIAIDAIINQRDTDVVCIYVAIGQKASTVAAIRETLRRHGVLDKTVIVSATAADSAPMQYIAPMSGAAIGEYFMYNDENGNPANAEHPGGHVLVVYDDLSKQAVAYRQMSLTLHRPPGREAYPGDIFYLHSRLLERAVKMNDALGAGSMTALPIIETQEGDVSAYIPTNVISITDGQIYLQSNLFFQGQRPAVDVGISVSRVGGAAQLASMKQVAGTLRLDLASYREKQAFSQFGSDLGEATQYQLNHGAHMMELLKQKRYAAIDVADQVIAIFAAKENFMDDLDLAQVLPFREELSAYMVQEHPQIRDVVRMGKMSDETQAELKRYVGEFKERYVRDHGLLEEESSEEKTVPGFTD